MKQLDEQHAKANRAGRNSLAEAFMAMETADECRALLRDLTTPAELEALVDRWLVAQLIDAGLPYREIHNRTGVSVTTVGRVARFLEMGHGGYRLALQRLQEAPMQDGQNQNGPHKGDR